MRHRRGGPGVNGVWGGIRDLEVVIERIFGILGWRIGCEKWDSVGVLGYCVLGGGEVRTIGISIGISSRGLRELS